METLDGLALVGSPVGLAFVAERYQRCRERRFRIEVPAAWLLQCVGRGNLDVKSHRVLSPGDRRIGIWRDSFANDRPSTAAQCDARGFAGSDHDGNAVTERREMNAEVPLRTGIDLALHFPFSGRDGLEAEATLGIRRGAEVERNAG